MSADNWAICPRCLARAEAALAELQQRAATSYGVLPVEEFDALRTEAAKGLDREALRTFREDYELGVDPRGEFYVSYGGSCSACGLSHEHKHTAQIA